MSGHGESTKQIVQSLLVNLVIAAVKAVAAVLTKSGSMLAEALHTTADCGNQLLLLFGVRAAKKAPDKTHPLGYGREIYFWSFIVALLLFAAGGVFSIVEGIHKIHEPEKVEKVWLGLLILGVSFLLEGYALFSNVREMNVRRKQKPFMKYLRETKDSDLVVVFGENAAAVMGLFFAFFALIIADRTGDGRWDGIGSVVIGLVLVGVAGFLASEVKSLLLGESADAEIEEAAIKVALAHPNLERVLHIVTIQQGPGEVMVSIKVSFKGKPGIEEVCGTINEFEAELRKERPEVRWLFVEPDMPRDVVSGGAREERTSES